MRLLPGLMLLLPGLAQMTFELAEQLARIALDDVERPGVRCWRGVIAIIAFLLELGLRALQRRLTPWHGEVQ